MSSLALVRGLVGMAAVAAMNQGASACSTCFGDPSSPLTQGAITGMSVLLGFTGFVLGSVALVSRVWVVRARKLAAAGESVPSD